MINYRLPKFSVLLAVYYNDNPKYLTQAINSLFKQTVSFSQLVIVCDGPLTSALDNIIENISNTNSNVKIVRIKKNVGLGSALNEGLKECEYEIVFRMDSDDICREERFSVQLKFLMENPSIDVLSSSILEFSNTNLKPYAIRSLPLKHNQILNYAKLRNPINHMAVVFKRSLVISNGGYPPLKKAQDYGLWALLLSKGYKFANIEKVLVDVRAGKSLYKRRNINYLYYEFKLLLYLRSISFLNRFEFIKSLFIRIIARILPINIKEFLYIKFARNKIIE